MKYIYYILFTLLLVAGLYSCKNTTDNPVDNPGNPVSKDDFIRSVKPEYTDIEANLVIEIENNDKYGGYHILIDDIEVFPKLLSKDALIKKLQINVPPDARNGKLKFVFQDTVIYYRRNLKIIHIEDIKLTESGEQIQVNGFGFNHMANLIINLDSIQFKVDYRNDNLILLKSPAGKETLNGLLAFKSDYFLCKVQVNLDFRKGFEYSGLKISARNIAMTIHTTYNQRSVGDENLNQNIDIDTKSENMTVKKIDGEISFSRYQYPNISTVKLFFQAGNQLTINLNYYYTMTYNDEVTEYYQWNGTFFNIPYKIDQDSISIFLKGQDFSSRTSGLYYFYQLNIFIPGHYSGTTEKYSKNYNITDDSYINIVIK